MTHRLQPIDLFHETLMAKRYNRVTAGSAQIQKQKVGVWLSDTMASELALEAWAYKQFFLAANEYARFVDLQSQGVYIAKPSMEFARDSYVTARDRCVKMNQDHGVPAPDIKRE